MKVLKNTLLFLLLIVVLLLVSGLFVNQKYQVKTSIVVAQKSAAVYDYIKFLDNQKQFSAWAKMDPNMKVKTKGTDATVGYVSSWQSNNKDVGRGEQEIIGMQENKRIDYELRFFEPFTATDYAYLELEPIDTTHTNIVWCFDGKLDYPMNIMRLFVDFENMIESDLQAGLDNLKTILEK